MKDPITEIALKMIDRLPDYYQDERDYLFSPGIIIK